MATATQIKDLQTRLDKLFKPAGTVKATNDTWSRNKLALDTMESANKIPVLNQSGSTKGKSKASAAALKAYPNMPESYKEMLSDLAGREGYNPNFYLDGSGYLTTGVGLTGEYVADETPFRSMTDHENKAKRLVPGLEYYTPEIQKSIIHAAYRGDLTYPKDDKYGNKAGDPYKWVNNLNSGNWNEAADELLRNDEYFASRGEDSKGNSVDIKNPGLQSYFEDIHNSLKEQHYIENPSDRPEDSGFISDIVDDGLAFGNKVLRKVDRTVDSTVDSVQGFMDEMLSTGEMPKDKVPSIKTQEIPVPEQGAAVPKSENEMATQAQVDSFLRKRNERIGQEETSSGRVNTSRLNDPKLMSKDGVIVGREPVDKIGEYIGPNEIMDNPLYKDEITKAQMFQDAKRMQQGQINLPNQMGRGDGVSEMKRRLADVLATPNRQQASQLNMTPPQGTVDQGLMSALGYQPAVKEPAAVAYPSKQSNMDNILQQTQLNLDKRSGENYHFDRNGKLVIDINPHLQNPTIPMGTFLDGNGQPVVSGNGSMIGSPTQNPAYRAPAGGKGANATPQSAIDQLTGVKGFGGK